MDASSTLILLTSRATSRHQTVYGGICLNEQCASPWSEEPWRAWLYSGDQPVQVEVVHHHVTVSHLSTSRGSMWERDGIVTRAEPKPRETVRQLARNGFESVKFTPPWDVPLPSFVASDPGLHPWRDDLVVRMVARRMLDFPDARVEQDTSESRFGLRNRAVRDTREWLETTPPFADLAVPVELAIRDRPIRCVLHVHELTGADEFRCRLYRSNRAAPVVPGTVLRRHAQRDLRDRGYRHEAEIATVLSVIGSGPIQSEEPGTYIVGGGGDGAVYPIVCLQCGTQFGVDAFTAEQRELIDLWGWYHPLDRERSLLMRARDMFRRRPEARGQVRSKLDALLRSPDRTGDVTFWNTPFDQMPDPRAKDYPRKLDEWTAGDRELREFLEHSTCDVDVRLPAITASAEKWERMIRGRCVVCPSCESGAVALRDRDRS